MYTWRFHSFRETYAPKSDMKSQMFVNKETYSGVLLSDTGAGFDGDLKQ